MTQIVASGGEVDIVNFIGNHERIKTPPSLFNESEESESEIFIRSFQTQETSAKTITGRCRRGHLEK